MSTLFNITCFLSLVIYIALILLKIIRDKRETKAMNLLIETHKQKVNSLCNTYKRNSG